MKDGLRRELSTRGTGVKHFMMLPQPTSPPDSSKKIPDILQAVYETEQSTNTQSI